MITVFGSIVLDLVTNVPAFPVPGESVLVETFHLTPGGKGANQALAARRAGAEVRFVGATGDDDFGARALANLAAAGIDVSAMVKSEDLPTACATINVTPDGANQIVIAAGANYALDNRHLADDWLGPGDILQLQLEIPFEEIWQAAARGRSGGTTVILNAAPFAPVPDAVLQDLHILNVNEIEAAALARSQGLPSDDLKSLARTLADKFDLTMIITIGEDGAICAAGDRVLRVNALPITARDTVGAGDAFSGAFAAALSIGEPLAECLKWGAVAGSLACLETGAQTSLPDRQAIEDHLGDIQLCELR